MDSLEEKLQYRFWKLWISAIGGGVILLFLLVHTFVSWFNQIPKGSFLDVPLWFLWVALILFVVQGHVFASCFNPIATICSKCGKSVTSRVDWICGYCDQSNTDQAGDSFMSSCKHCTRRPEAYVCPHCNSVELILSKGDKSLPAKILLPKKPVENKKPEKDEKAQAHLELKREIEREIELEILKKQLAQLKAQGQTQEEEMSERDKLEKRFSDLDEKLLGVRMIEARARASAAQEFKDNPDLLERKLLVIDAFVREHGLDPDCGETNLKAGP